MHWIMDVPYLATEETILPAWCDWNDIRTALCEPKVARCTPGCMCEDLAFEATLVVLLDPENDDLTWKTPLNSDLLSR